MPPLGDGLTASSTVLEGQWASWADALETAFVSLLTVCYLFRSRDVEPTLQALRGAVQQMASMPVDGKTLRLISSVYGTFVQLVIRGASDNDMLVRMCFDETASSKKRARSAEREKGSKSSSRQPRSFNSRPPKLAPLTRLVEIHKPAFRAALIEFASQAESLTVAPPALHAGDLHMGESGSKEPAGNALTNGTSAHAGSDDSIAGQSGGLQWNIGEPVTARNFCAFVRHPSTTPEYRQQLVHIDVTPPHQGSSMAIANLCPPLHPMVEEALRHKSIESLYMHQAEALSASEHLMIATPTSSGKSLVYTIPVVQSVLEDAHARSLLLFPTKALAQDQLGSLSAFADRACPHLYAAALDGDTSGPDRKQIASRCHVILSNPDLLHVTILPNHAEWSELLANLKMVVIDEAHAYHGVFGSHVSLVLRRLQRVASMYGSSPRFVCCSATLANPVEHMIQLIGLKREAVRVIHADSVPKGFRTMAMWNPPMLSASALIAWHENLPPGAARRRVSSLEEASRLLAHLINHGLRSIAFVRTRALAERLYEATYERLGAAERAGFAVYRAGYSKEKRRQIEQALFGGKLTAVVATNALELGVDIGSLDVTIHLGYPGTTASLAQQAGRAGRGGRDALAIMIARDNPLEQHLMRAPRAVLERPVEQTVLNPYNPFILRQHLVAAAREIPLHAAQCDRCDVIPPKDSFHTLLPADACLGHEPEPQIGKWCQWGDVARLALDAGELRVSDGRLHAVCGRSSHGVSLRDIDSRRVRLLVVPRPPMAGEVSSCDRASVNADVEYELETMEESVAQLRIYDGAIYLHSGAAYIVHELDLVERGEHPADIHSLTFEFGSPASHSHLLDTTHNATVARLYREDVAYYTEPRDHTRVLIMRRVSERPVFGCLAYHGPMEISKQVYGYRKCARTSGRLLELCDAERPLPPIEYATHGVWIDLPSQLRDCLEGKGVAYARGGLHAAEHLAISLAPLCATCEPFDLGCQCTRRVGDEHGERFLLFERRRGGVGISAALLAGLEEIFQAALARLESCECEHGCLSCIYMHGCGDYNEGLDKAAACAILRWLILGPPTSPK